MKRISTLFMLIAASAIAFSSCNTIEDLPSPNGHAVILRAGNPEAEPDTKTIMNGLSVNWNTGDVIGVSDATKSNIAFTSTLSAPASISEFTSEEVISGDLYAYYPYTSNGVTTDGKAKIDIPNIQTPTLTSFDGSADILVSKMFTVDETTEVADLEFTRRTAVVKVVLKDTENLLTGETLKSLSLTTESESLTGRAYLSFSEQSLTELYYNQNKTVTAEYAPDARFEVNGSNPVLLSVYPVTLASGSRLTVNAVTDNKTIEKAITLPANIVLSAGKVTTLNVAVSATNIIDTPTGQPLPIADYYSWNDATTDSSTDLSNQITTIEDQGGVAYLSQAEKVYAGANNTLKLGTGSAIGSFKTIALDLSSDFDIFISTKQYGSDTGEVEVIVDEVLVKTITPNSDFTETKIACSQATTNSTITVRTTSKRAYIGEFIVVKKGETKPSPKPVIKAEAPSAVAADVTVVEIPYEIINPVEGVSLVAEIAADASWITSASVSSDIVTLTITKQAENATEARSGSVTLKYSGATDKVLTVIQNAPSNIDILDLVLTGVSGNSYKAWDNKKSNTSAIYAGQSSGNYNSIQLRSVSPSGIVTTASGGYAKKVTVVWNSNTASGRKLNIYGKNSAYESSSDLYGADAGVLLGSIVNGTTEFVIPYDYEFIGLRSDDGAMYLTEIRIEWSQTPSGSTPTFSVNIAEVTNGSVVADKTSGIQAGETVVLTITPDQNYKLQALTVDGTDVTSSVTDEGEYTFNMPANDVSISAQFASIAQASVSFIPSDFTDQGVSGSGGPLSATKGGIAFSCDKGFGTTQIRCYSGGTITISAPAGKKITSVSFKFNGTYTGGLDTSYSPNSNSCTYSLTSQARFTEISVTYE